MMSFNEAAALLKERDRFGILIHGYPDGDAVGSAYALCLALKSIGKLARVICVHDIPAMYSYITDTIDMPDFEPLEYIAVDVADISLLGKGYEKYTDVLLSIDHHATNKLFARHTIVAGSASAASELIYELVSALGVPVTKEIAECIYTGIATDTGCFKYSNTTAHCHMLAAKLLEKGIRFELINRLMFDTKSRSRVEMERLMLDSIEFHCDGKVAIAAITNEMKRIANAGEGDMEGLTSIPRQIEGVVLGVTVREKEGSSYKVSIRSYEPVNAASICALFGGGGHNCAAGCTLDGTLEEVKSRIIAACRDYIV